MKQREVIGFVSAALVWPVVARAQQADKTPRVAFLGPDRTSPPQIDYYQAFNRSQSSREVSQSSGAGC